MKTKSVHLYIDFVLKYPGTQFCGTKDLYVTHEKHVWINLQVYSDMHYPCGVTCLWLVTGPKGYGLTVDVLELQLPYVLDYIELGEGYDTHNERSIVDRLQGWLGWYEQRTYAINTNMMWVVFESVCSMLTHNDFYHGRNFEVEIFAKNLTEGEFLLKITKQTY